MIEKKTNNYKTPDLAKMQEVIIDSRTKIYIAVGTDPAEARNRYLSRIEAKNKLLVVPKKAVTTT